MKTTDEQIRTKAVAGMVRIEGLLRTKSLLAQKFLYLVVDRTDVKIINHLPTSERLICKVTRQDCLQGFSPQKWNNVLLSIMAFVRAWEESQKSN